MSFDPALPTTRDWIRLRVGDTSTSKPVLPDATYDALIARFGEREGAAQVALYFATNYATLPDWKDADASESRKNPERFFKELAEEFRNGASFGSEAAIGTAASAVLIEPDLTNYKTD